jgi:predicted dehydrogenase
MSRPKVGFLGVGWIGRHRMEKMLETGAIEAAAICDPSPEMVQDARALAPEAAVVPSLEAMLALGLDGIVIATPSALHAEQSISALNAGAAVFCQKPLGRDAGEVEHVVDAARRADRLLGVDLSYRHTEAVRKIAEAMASGRLGHVFAADLTFHNAYGPGKPWFFDRKLSGGGCVIDLGVHLVDLALWLLGFPAVEDVQSRLFAGGTPLQPDSEQVEDYAIATLTLASGAVVRVACSWNLHAGQPADISARFYGSNGGAALRNVDGSFFDFTGEVDHGTEREVVAQPPDDWGGRAAAAWARQLADDGRFDPACEKFMVVSEVLDRIYAGS